MHEIVVAALVTGGFGVIVEILRRFWAQNKKDHNHVVSKITELSVQSKEVREKVYDISNDVREVKADVRELRSNHRDLEKRVDEFDK